MLKEEILNRLKEFYKFIENKEKKDKVKYHFSTKDTKERKCLFKRNKK